ncbi:MAG: cytochrome c3 family protein [Thermoanaerobaculaceae bacterium]
MARKFLAVFAVAGIAAVLMAAQNPETLTLDKAQAKQPPVAFPHKIHADKYACDSCHHTQKGLSAKAEKVESCASCHLDPEKAEIPSMRQVSLTKNPFHTSCINCHKKEAKGPTKCAECHKK